MSDDSKVVYSAIDAAPVILYAKRDPTSEKAYPVIANAGGELNVAVTNSTVLVDGYDLIGTVNTITINTVSVLNVAGSGIIGTVATIALGTTTVDGTLNALLNAGTNLIGSVSCTSMPSLTGNMSTLCYGAASDSANRLIRVDMTTHTLQTIDYVHHEIHNYSHFFIDVCDVLSINNAVDVVMRTPTSGVLMIHLAYELSCDANKAYWLYENCTTLTAGTALARRNSKRNASIANTSGTLVQIITNTSEAIANTYTSTSGATKLIGNFYFGSGRSGGSHERNNEIICNTNSTYLLRVVGIVAGFVGISLHWYEHIDKT